MIVEFKYNHNCLRTQKKVVENGVTTTYDYTLHGKLITHLTKRVVTEIGAETTETLHFFYDAQSRPAFLEYNGEMYRYVHNLQGDIVAIVDSAGNAVVEYKYDAWGDTISIAGLLMNTLGAINPFRHRCYVWDGDTKKYYLRTRYYYPEWNRFINIDNKGTLILCNNPYTYCANKPVLLCDENGCAPTDAMYPEPTDALTFEITGNHIKIDVYLTITGDIDPGIVVDGIMDYWNTEVLAGKDIISISTNVYVGESPNGNSIVIETSEGSGVTGAVCTVKGVSWIRGHSKVYLYRYYEKGGHKTDDDLKWSIAHEFGHVIGIPDYYINEGADPNFQSIMNGRNMKVSLADVCMLVKVIISKKWAEWNVQIPIE